MEDPGEEHRHVVHDREDEDRQQAVAEQLDVGHREDRVQVAVETMERAAGRPQAPPREEEAKQSGQEHDAEVAKIQVGFADVGDDAALPVVLAAGGRDLDRVVAQARLGGPEGARDRQGHDGQVGRAEVHLTVIIGHGERPGVLVEELLAGGPLQPLGRAERIAHQLDRLVEIARLDGLPDRLEAGQDQEHQECAAEDRQARPAPATRLQVVGREKHQRQDEHEPVVTLHRDQT